MSYTKVTLFISSLTLLSNVALLIALASFGADPKIMFISALLVVVSIILIITSWSTLDHK